MKLLSDVVRVLVLPAMVCGLVLRPFFWRYRARLVVYRRRSHCRYGVIESASRIGLTLLILWSHAVSAQAPAPQQSDRQVTVFFAPFSNLERIDVEVMSQARRSIDIAAYVLSDHAVLQALTEAARRAVRIRLYLFEPEVRKLPLAPEHPFVRLSAMPGVEIRLKPEGEDLMHWKAAIIDGRLVRTGSANFSASGLKRQDNDLLLITKPDIVRAYEGAFTVMWERATNKRFP